VPLKRLSLLRPLGRLRGPFGAFCFLFATKRPRAWTIARRPQYCDDDDDDDDDDVTAVVCPKVPKAPQAPEAPEATKVFEAL